MFDLKCSEFLVATALGLGSTLAPRYLAPSPDMPTPVQQCVVNFPSPLNPPRNHPSWELTKACLNGAISGLKTISGNPLTSCDAIYEKSRTLERTACLQGLSYFLISNSETPRAANSETLTPSQPTPDTLTPAQPTPDTRTPNPRK